jgi:hypothetical protein
MAWLSRHRSDDAGGPDDQQLPQRTERAGRPCNPFTFLCESLGSSVSRNVLQQFPGFLLVPSHTDRPSIEAALAAGTTVIVDRYYYSGCVYSAAKQNPTLSLAWTRHPEVGLPRPDLALFLDISAEDAAKRGGYGTEKYEKKELQDRVRELFGVMMKSQEKEDFVRIDAGPSVEEVQRRIREEVDKAIKKVDDGGLPLGYVESW